MTNIIADKFITGFFIVIFATLWFFSTRYFDRPSRYSIIIYDKFGNQIEMYDLRVSFNTIEVATSHINEYQKRFPQYKFNLDSIIPQIEKRTSFDPNSKKI